MKPLRPIALNKRFMRAFLAADPPCFALGLAQEDERTYAFLALRPSMPVPPETFAPGFAFGHSILGNDHFEVLHFAFAFYGSHTYNTLVDSNNPIVRTVLDAMLASGEYFFFAIDAHDRKATSFKTEIGKINLSHNPPPMRVTCSWRLDFRHSGCRKVAIGGAFRAERRMSNATDSGMRLPKNFRACSRRHRECGAIRICLRLPTNSARWS
jgi:hypothetical protein